MTFSIEEMVPRTFLAGDELKLYKRPLKGEPLIEGKLVYSTLLRQKVAAAMGNDSTFSMKDAFKSVEAGIFRAYMFCGHKVKNVVTYVFKLIILSPSKSPSNASIVPVVLLQ